MRVRRMRIDQHSTAIDAFHAHHASGKAQAQQSRILAFIESSGGDWSIGEIAHMLGMEKSTVSGRLNEMLESGSLVAKTKRKCRQSGIKIRPVGLPVKQLELLN